jgi:hypothetical protein
MKRFFFDYRSADQSLYDYQGDEFGTSHAAIKFGEAIADNLKRSLGNEWIGWHVEVRNPEGKKICCYPSVRARKQFDAGGAAD